ncbi:MAG: ABC transporter permease [Anaerolineales bacterium]|nr:ABC transporter permease [Anaerolineales bacterium]MCA9928642.1 ABC transporter permease [Anaerolineales bacterium]
MTEFQNGNQNGALSTRLMGIWRSVSVPITAIVLALVIGGIILASSGANPIDAYAALYKGAFGSTEAFGRTLEKATPLILGGLAVAFAFKAALFNIGGQGQLLLAAIFAGYLGFRLQGLPFIIHMPVALLGGALAGALFGAIPGALKTYTGAHEVITTIMLNFIATNITDFLADGPWKDEGIVARTPKVLETAVIPAWGNIPIGFFIAVIVAVAIWYLLYKTTLGYEIRTVGLNPNAAQYAGIRVARIVILTMTISGLLAGLGGAIETLGIVGRFQPGFNAGLGFDGITIALLGRTSPIGVIPAALLVGAMQAGSSQMQFDANVPFQIIDVIQALILFFVSADMIVRWILRSRAVEGEEITLSSGYGGN